MPRPYRPTPRTPAFSHPRGLVLLCIHVKEVSGQPLQKDEGGGAAAGPPDLLRGRSKIPNPFTFRYAPQTTATETDGMHQDRVGAVIDLDMSAGPSGTGTLLPTRLRQSPVPGSSALPSVVLHGNPPAAACRVERQRQHALREPMQRRVEADLKKDVIVDLTLVRNDILFQSVLHVLIVRLLQSAYAYRHIHPCFRSVVCRWTSLQCIGVTRDSG
jgi:hypothetical protein